MFTPKFENTYKNLFKKHYKKDKRSGKVFEEQLNDFLDKLEKNPFIGDLENSPSLLDEGEFLMKKRFKDLPGLKGASRKGRLIYLIKKEHKLVYLLWIYTHEEFPTGKNKKFSRPPDKKLKQVIKSANQSID